MWKLFLLTVAILNLACCSVPSFRKPECEDARIFIGRLEKEIILLQDRPIQRKYDGLVDRVLIQELRAQSLDVQSQYRAYCTE